MPMHRASDYIHPTPRGGRCRVRVYLPEDKRDAPVVICSELPNNDGSSITYSAHQIAAEVISYNEFLLRSEEHTSELQSRQYLVCRLLLEKKNHMPTTT